MKSFLNYGPEFSLKGFDFLGNYVINNPTAWFKSNFVQKTIVLILKKLTSEDCRLDFHFFGQIERKLNGWIENF